MGRRPKIAEEFVILLLSLVGLIIASVMIGEGGERLSRALGQSFAGGVILGFATALPETVLVISAIILGLPDAAYSSVTGANAMLMTLGVGLLGLVYFALYRRPVVMEGKYRDEVFSLLVATAIIFAYILLSPFLPNGFLRYVVGLALIATYAYYIYANYREGAQGEKGGADIFGALMILAGGIITVLLSPAFLSSLKDVSEGLDLPYALMVYFLTPIAAELEEKLSAYLVVFKSPSNGGLALYSFIGSKIQNSTVLVGLSIMFTNSQCPACLAVLVMSNLFGAIVLRDGKLTPLESSVGIVLYVALSAFLGAYSGTSFP